MEIHLGVEDHPDRRFQLFYRNCYFFSPGNNSLISRFGDSAMSNKRKNDGDARSSDKHARSDSPSEHDRDRSDSISENDLKRIMGDVVAAQIPRLILETSKVVSEQLEADRRESRSFTTFSQEMKAMRQRQEEIAIQSKAAALKSDGNCPDRLVPRAIGRISDKLIWIGIEKVNKSLRLREFLAGSTIVN